MTPEIRQALREKHQPYPHTQWFPVCATCMTQYPCDVIRVLDWAEAVAEDLSARIEGGP